MSICLKQQRVLPFRFKRIFPKFKKVNDDFLIDFERSLNEITFNFKMILEGVSINQISAKENGWMASWALILISLAVGSIIVLLIDDILLVWYLRHRNAEGETWN